MEQADTREWQRGRGPTPPPPAIRDASSGGGPTLPLPPPPATRPRGETGPPGPWKPTSRSRGGGGGVDRTLPHGHRGDTHTHTLTFLAPPLQPLTGGGGRTVVKAVSSHLPVGTPRAHPRPPVSTGGRHRDLGPRVSQ